MFLFVGGARNGLLAATLIIVCLCARVSSAQPDGELTPEELAEIEAALGEDEKSAPEDTKAAKSTGDTDPVSGAVATVASFLPDISIVLDVALAYFSDDEQELQTGGHDPNTNGFNLQQVEISFNKSVDPYFRFDSNIVFGISGVEIEEAYASTLALPLNMKVRAGQFLSSFGRLNGTHPHAWDFVDQPFMWGKVLGGEGSRGLGAELSVLMPLPWYVDVIGSTQHAGELETGRSFYGPDLEVKSPIDLVNTLALKQFFDLSDNWSFLWGLSVANGPNPNGLDARTDIYGTDVYLKYRPIDRQSRLSVALQAEWLVRRRQIPLDVLQDTGGYAQLNLRAGRWGTGLRYEYGSSAYDMAGDRARDPLDPEHTAERHRGTTAVTFWPTEFSRLRAQGSVDLPAWREGPIWAGMLAMEVVVGSHGAHNF